LPWTCSGAATLGSSLRLRCVRRMYREQTAHRIRFDAHTRRMPTIAVPMGVAIPPLAMVSFTVGDDGRLLERVDDADYAALVIEGAGGGSVSSTGAEIVGRIAEVMPFVFSTRTRNAAVLERTYGGAGGEIDLSRRGVLLAGTLDGPKARIVLGLLLCMRGIGRYNEASS
jgi:L-asparaginase